MNYRASLANGRDRRNITLDQDILTSQYIVKQQDRIWDEAIAGMWVATIRQKTMPGDRDLLIAAFAIQLMQRWSRGMSDISRYSGALSIGKLIDY